MDAIKNFVKTKAAGWYVSVAALVCALITLIVYTVRGGNAYSPVSPLAVAMLVLGLIANAAVLVKDFRIGAFVPFVFYVVTFGVLMNSEMLFFSNVLTGIDNNSLDPGFVAFMVTLLLAVACGFAAAIMKLKKNDQ